MIKQLKSSDEQAIEKYDKLFVSLLGVNQKMCIISWITYDDIGKYNFFMVAALGMCLVLDGDSARSTIHYQTLLVGKQSCSAHKFD